VSAQEAPATAAPRLPSVSRVCDVIARGALGLACVALATMALVEGWQVIARYVFNDSPSWTEPIALLCMSTVMMLGAAVSVRADRHFGFFIAVEHAPPRISRPLRLLARLVAFAIGVLLALWGGQLLVDGWSVAMAGAPLPQGIVYLPIALGGTLIALFSLEKAVG
jgi:TRAP-type C4-dicarboxylate transport system permease small subunit